MCVISLKNSGICMNCFNRIWKKPYLLFCKFTDLCSLMSPQHGLSVHILLNLDTGRASPQFHAKFDDDFDTTRPDSVVKPPMSRWQERTFFFKRAANKATESATTPTTKKKGPNAGMRENHGPRTSGTRTHDLVLFGPTPSYERTRTTRTNDREQARTTRPNNV